MRENELTKRLAVLADLAQGGKLAADVGADHAALSVYLLSTGRFEKMVISDVNRAPLLRARGVIERNSLSDRAEFYLADGIKELPGDVSCFFIAGMGGETIADILLRGIENAKDKELILQPMSKEDRLRRMLLENGFDILREAIVSENGKLFVIMKAVYTGIKQKKDELSYLIGDCNMGSSDPDTLSYVKKIYNRLLKERELKRRAGIDVQNDDDLIYQIEERLLCGKNEDSGRN